MYYTEQVLLETAKKFDTSTSSIKTNLYPKVEARLNTPKGKTEYKKLIASFIEHRSQGLYDTIPIARIFFGDNDVDALFKCLDFSKDAATSAILNTYYGHEKNFSPLAAKDPFTVTQMCVIRYYTEKKMKKEAELAMLHLAFSGKFYPSLHYRSYPTTPPVRHVMEYTVNNVLSTKFDLISEGSVIGCIRKIGLTWLNTYAKRFKSFGDEDVVYMIQQLYSRIGSFMKNVATAYYKVYEDKDELYIAYASDSLEDGNYHLADSDSLRISKITEKTLNYITSTGIDYTVCKNCADENVTVNEIKSIIESIMANPEYLPLIKELISLMLVTYFQNSSIKDVTNVDFIVYTISAKPNAKQQEIVRQKDIIETFLVENSKSYIRRRSRNATRNSYEKAIRKYFGLTIHNSNR